MKAENAYCAVCNTEVPTTFVLEHQSDVFRKTYRLVRCDRCATSICTPQLTERELSDYYVEEEVVGAGKYHQWIKKYRYIYNWIASHIGEQGSVMEIGCNSANQLRYFREQGWDALGFEFSRACREYAKHENAIEVVDEPLNEYCRGNPDRRFDLALLIHTFEHITDPSEFLSQIKSALKPGGVLFIEVPNGDSWTYDLLGRFENVACLPFHSYLYTRESLKRLLVREGFEIVAERGYSLKEDGGLLTSSLARRVRHGLLNTFGDNAATRVLAATAKSVIRFYPNRPLLTRLAAARDKSASFVVLSRTPGVDG